MKLTVIKVRKKSDKIKKENRKKGKTNNTHITETKPRHNDKAINDQSKKKTDKIETENRKKKVTNNIQIPETKPRHNKDQISHPKLSNSNLFYY